MEDSTFTIYNASAGSGKTYTLAKAYLRILLSEKGFGKFRQILAITFTNKAVDEMKSRILESLHRFSKDTILADSDPLFQELALETGLSAGLLRDKSRLLLKQILHNYSFFEISTIDKFNHKIIRTFARDLQLSQSFEVELDTDSMLEKAVAQLLERAGKDRNITNVLLDFSLNKIDENKSWNVAHDLKEIGRLLFQEDHWLHLEKIRAKPIQFFQRLQRTITKQVHRMELKVGEEAEQALQKIANEGFVHEDFPRQVLPNHFKKIIGGEFDLRKLYKNKLEQSLMENNILKVNDGRDPMSLSNYVLARFSTIKATLYRRAYLKNIHTNIVPLTVLNEIASEIKNIEKDEGKIPISALNQLISKEIKNQPVPFIYERLGEKYRHYFIDEFQDTSKVQWENLIPLISNALESEDGKGQKGSLFLVGDVKQAIYRWRGGKAEQFLSLLEQRSNPFSIVPKIKSLDTNWRSASEIIAFNNDFFSFVAPVLKNGTYQKLFLEGCKQNSTDKSGGYVQISFVDSNPSVREKAYCDSVHKTIAEVTAVGYSHADICILVRDNNKGALLANFLSEKDVPIISSDSLLLCNNDTVRFLIALLNVMENPKDRVSCFKVLSFLGRESAKKHDFIVAHMDNVEEFLVTTFGFSCKNLKSAPVLEILERAIIQFELATGSGAHLVFLMDEVLDVQKGKGPEINTFLDHWEKNKAALSISAPNAVNAVKIMTIHKAKGLEFPIVIFPFANALIDDKRKKKRSWVASPKIEYDWGMEEFLLSTNKDMLQYNESAKQAYLKEEEKTQLDAINVLYVALTRAENGLFIISEEENNALDLNKVGSYGQLFGNYVQNRRLPTKQNGEHYLGTLAESPYFQQRASMENSQVPYIVRPKGDGGFAVATKAGQLWGTLKEEALEMGTLVHHALGKITYLEDAPSVLGKLDGEGHFQGPSGKAIRHLIEKTINHPLLREYYSKPYTIYNEQEILTADGKTIRPDRIAISNNEAVVLDFKTGKTQPGHKEQVSAYGNALKAMGFSLKNSIIVYLDDNINPLFL